MTNVGGVDDGGVGVERGAGAAVVSIVSDAAVDVDVIIA